MSHSRPLLAALGLLCLVPTTAWASNATFTILPYVFSIHGESIAVAWQYAEGHAGNTEASVTLYQGDKLLRQVAAEKDGSLGFASLPIPACGFGSDLSYQVSGQDHPVALTEVPCGNPDATTQFSFLADSQTDASLTHAFATEMLAFPARAILHGGDLVDTGEDNSMWINYFTAMEPVGGSRVLFPTPGNHEYRHDANVPNWKHYFRSEASQSHYAFDLGPARVIALNSNFEDDRSQVQGQLEWLKAELAVPSKWKIIYFHHPAYSVSIDTSFLSPRKEWVYLQDYYVPLFEEFKVDLVLNGHVHLFETSQKGGVHYVTVGPSGGVMGWYGGKNEFVLKYGKQRSIVNLEAGPQSLRAMSIGMDGTVLDDLILRK